MGSCRVAYLPRLKPGGAALLVSGTAVNSSDAEVDFIAREASVIGLRRRLGTGSGHVPHFEVLRKTYLARSAVAGFELVSKPLFGAQGKGLRRLRCPADLPSAEESAGVWYLQRYVPPEGGDRDFRVFVIDGEPVAGMARVGASWITNVHRGGKPEPITVGGELGVLAVAAARAVGAVYAGVDLLEERGTGRLFVLEVNSQPAWQGLQTVTRFDIAQALLGAIARRLAR
jgi:RimK family alpha-L-glutamate ligase